MKKQLFKTPGDLIRADLEEYGWTQIYLSEMSGIDAGHLSKLINGKKAMTPARARQLEAVTHRNALDYFLAQAYVWFFDEVNGRAVGRSGKRAKKEGERS